MHFSRHARRGFSLLELIMAMGLFAIAAVSLAEALNTISLTVSESIEDAELREKLRAALLEATRDPNIQPDTRETNPDESGVYFRIEVARIEDLQSVDGNTLSNVFRVDVTALRPGPLGRTEELDTAGTWVYPAMF